MFLTPDLGENQLSTLAVRWQSEAWLYAVEAGFLQEPS